MSCVIKNGKYFTPNGAESKLYTDLKEKVGDTQAQDLFVLAYTPNFIRDVQQELIYNHKNKLPQIPNNLNFKQKGNTIEVFEADELDESKGRIILTSYKDGFKIKSVLVNEEERGEGYGKALYTFTARKMISEGMNLYSDQTRTEAADGMWDYLAELGVTDASKRVIYAKPLSSFDKNGEINAEIVLQYATQLNENTESLSFVEQQEVRMMLAEFPQIEDSNELADLLTKAFYKEGLFSPSAVSLKQLYSKYETDLILSDINVLAKVKETVEKLKRTENIYNTTVLEATYKTNELNIFGKLKTENPYKIKQDIIEEFGGVDNADLSEIKDRSITQEYLDQFKRVPAVFEDGTPIIEQIIYPNAIKVVEDEKILDAINTLLNAPEIVDTSKVEKKLSTWLLNYGINIEGFTKDLLPTLKQFIEEPSVANTAAFSDKYREVFNMPEKQREYVLKIENKDRDLVYLETNQSEQQLFEQNLLQTEIANVYHRIEKVDFQQMKEAFQLGEDVTELDAYKQYFGYTEKPVIENQEFYPITLTNSLDYLTGEFISDFHIEKLKNPNGLNDKFKITEKGIEQIYNDPISTAEIQAYLQEDSKLNTALKEYSIISKQMGNFEDSLITPLTNKYNNRLFAVNNFNKVGKPVGDVNRLNRETALVKNATKEFLNIEGELFELINKDNADSIYARIEKNTNLVYNELNPQQPSENIIVNPQIQNNPEYVQIKKSYKPKNIEGKLDC